LSCGLAVGVPIPTPENEKLSNCDSGPARSALKGRKRHDFSAKNPPRVLDLGFALPIEL